MKQLLFLSLFFTIVSCQQKADKEVNVVVEDFEMYEMSEMATLMEQMYHDNEFLKERILKGDTIGKFPVRFLDIHKAVLTKEEERDAFFESQATKFIQAQELIYKEPENAKAHFNTGVDACIQCHQQKCRGPIPRIKKLYIK